ncbi:MAG: hypothetical protein ACFCU6_07820 [Balneolaceae bacterium]
MSYKYPVIFLILSLLSFVNILSAQTTTGEQAVQQSLLPEIDPQDIEIRSQFRARFPGLIRQPILGMNPRPRVYQIDPNRMPFIETFDQVMASLPVAMLSRPEAPEIKLLPYADSNIGFLRGGFGNYTTPESELYLMTNIGNRNWISANVDFNSTNGHLNNQESSFRFFNGEIKYLGRVTDKTLLETRIGFFNNFNHLPAIESLDTTTGFETGRSEYDGITFSTRVKQNRNTIEGWEANLNGYFHSLDIFGDPLFLTTDADEFGIRADGKRVWAGNRLNETFSLMADLQFGSVDQTATGGSEFWSVTGFSGGYQRLFNFRTNIEADIGFYHVTDAVDNSTFYFAPKLGITQRLFNGFKVRGEVSGKPEHRNLMDYKRENRFLSPDTELQHSYTLELTGEVIIEPVHGTKVRGGVSYKDIDNHAFYTRETVNTDVTGSINTFYTLNYQDATDFKIFAGISQQFINNVFWLDADGHWRRPRLSGNEKIPFEESFTIRSALSFKPVQRLLFEGWGEFVGSRENPAGSNLDSFLLIGTRVELALTNRIGVYGKIVNLLNQEYEIWQGYEERDFQAFAGFTIIF